MPHLSCRHILTISENEPDSPRRRTEKTLCLVDEDATPFIRYAIVMHNLLVQSSNLIEHTLQVCENEEHSKMRERSNPSNTSNSTYKEGVYKWSAEEEEAAAAHGPSCTRIDQGHSLARSVVAHALAPTPRGGAEGEG